MKYCSWIILFTAALLTGCSQPGSSDGTNQTGATLERLSRAGKVVYASATEFETHINGDKPVLVDFYATW